MSKDPAAQGKGHYGERLERSYIELPAGRIGDLRTLREQAGERPDDRCTLAQSLISRYVADPQRLELI